MTQKFCRVSRMGAVIVVAIGTVACNRANSPVGPTAVNDIGTGSARVVAGTAHDTSPGKPGGGAENYSADLDPLNSHVGYRPVEGHARFQINGDRFTAQVNATGLQPGMIHPQHIHAADQCPPASADVNGDGFIDVIEGVPFYGPILIPLDTDLTSQSAGSFPFVDNNGGALTYRQTVALSAMLADLNAPDPNPGDAVVKLGGQPLNLAGRHVVLHGVALDTPLPASVATIPGLPAQLTLPVACGEIGRIN